MKLLLIWTMGNEDMNFYALDPNTMAATWARQVAGQFISQPNENIFFDMLNDWLVTEAGRATQVSDHKPIPGPFSEVVVSGFIM
jgi:hypothetical protein